MGVVARVFADVTAQGLYAFLEGVAEAVVLTDRAWIREARMRGLEPPCCLGCAGVRYVQSHGAPLGTTRDYLDAPTAIERGVGTCMDFATYEVAKAREDGHIADVYFLGELPMLHAVALIDGVIHDPAGAVVDKGCGCA